MGEKGGGARRIYITAQGLGNQGIGSQGSRRAQRGSCLQSSRMLVGNITEALFCIFI